MLFFREIYSPDFSNYKNLNKIVEKKLSIYNARKVGEK